MEDSGHTPVIYGPVSGHFFQAVVELLESLLVKLRIAPYARCGAGEKQHGLRAMVGAACAMMGWGWWDGNGWDISQSVMDLTINNQDCKGDNKDSPLLQCEDRSEPILIYAIFWCDEYLCRQISQGSTRASGFWYHTATHDLKWFRSYLGEAEGDDDRAEVMWHFYGDVEVISLCADCLRLAMTGNQHNCDSLLAIWTPAFPNERHHGQVEKGSVVAKSIDAAQTSPHSDFLCWHRTWEHWLWRFGGPEHFV